MKTLRTLALLGGTLCAAAAGTAPTLGQPQPESATARAQAEATLLDRSAAVDRRIAVLDAIAGSDVTLFGRPRLAERLQDVMTDRQEPVELRLRVLAHLAELFFPMTHVPRQTDVQAADHEQSHHAVDQFNDRVRTLLDDPEPRLVRAAFSWLAIFQDEEALSRVVEFLEGERELPLSTGDAVGLLTFVDAAPWLPLIHRTYRGSRDAATREEALRVLADHEPARDDLIAVARGAREPVRLRTIALSALHAGQPDEFPALAAPLLADRTVPDALKQHAISLVRPQRNNPPYRQRKLGGFDDDFDRAVRALADRKDPVGELARLYLLETDPTWVARSGS